MNNNIEQEFLGLVQVVERMQQRISSLENINQTLIRSNKELIQLLEDNQTELIAYQRNLSFELNDPRNGQTDIWYPQIEPSEKAIEQIVYHNKSLARFGDGEFSAIAGRVRHQFQNEPDERLGQRLKEVLQSDEEKLLIGIADNYGSLDKYTEQAKREIRCYLNPQVRKEHLEILSPQKVYYDAYITRPYVMYEDNHTDAPARRFKNLQRIWSNRKCVIVEGSQTRMGVGNDLLMCASEIHRILAPAENAFRRYSEILEFCFEQSKDSLFLLALGPAATVLAYDLCKAGYQAVDVGHLDLEYEWFLKGEGHRTLVEGKYNNEVEGGRNPAEKEDETYVSQILTKF